MISLLLYALLGAAMFYLLIRARITRFLWNRYPAKLASFLDCPACTGFWYGAFLSLTLGCHEQLLLVGKTFETWDKALLVGFTTMVLQPIIVGLLQWGFHWTGAVVVDDSDKDAA